MKFDVYRITFNRIQSRDQVDLSSRRVIDIPKGTSDYDVCQIVMKHQPWPTYLHFIRGERSVVVSVEPKLRTKTPEYLIVTHNEEVSHWPWANRWEVGLAG